MLAGPADAGVAGVQIQVARLDHVAGDDRALEEVNMIQRVDQPGDVIEIGQARLPVLAAFRVDHVHGGPGGAEVNLGPFRPDVVLRILAVQGEVPRRDRQSVLHQAARKQQPALIGQGATGIGHQLDTRRDRLGQADLLQGVECRLVDAPYLAIGQRLVEAAFHPRLDGHFLGRDRCRAQLPPRLAPAPAALCNSLFRHGNLADQTRRSGGNPRVRPRRQWELTVIAPSPATLRKCDAFLTAYDRLRGGRHPRPAAAPCAGSCRRNPYRSG